MSKPTKTMRLKLFNAPQLEVGVVTPVHNRRTILVQTLQYVLAQTHLPARLVIVDDGSSDGTADAARAFLKAHAKDLDWHIVPQKKGSAAAARKAGYELVRHLPLVTFLDSDDHWPQDFLSRASSALAASPQVVAAVADRRYVDTTGGKQQEDCSKLEQDPHTWFFYHGGGVASCTVARTWAVDAAGGWKPELQSAEDAALFNGISLEGPWLHLPGAPVVFNLGDAAGRNEHNNLSRSFVDTEQRWAKVYEQIYADICRRRPAIDRAPLHSALAMRWRRAGKQHARRGDWASARTCLKRALYWQPAEFSTWRWLAKARLVARRAA